MKKEQIELANSGGLHLYLDIVTFGSGSPRTLLISGIHGSERTGQLLLSRLVEQLPEFIGTLSIVAIANPLGYAMDDRLETLSGLDINRQFTGKKDGRPAFQITAALTELASQYDFVIDLHNYTTSGLIQVGCSIHDDSAKIAELLSPDVIRINHTSQALKLDGTLSAAVRSAGKPYVLVELPPHERVTSEQIDNVTSGLIAHLQNCQEYVEQTLESIWENPFVRIRLVKASQTGVFYRNENLEHGDAVTKDEVLGTLVSTSDFSKTVILSPYDGLVCEMETVGETPVVAGETLFGIGEQLSDDERRA